MLSCERDIDRERCHFSYNEDITIATHEDKATEYCFESHVSTFTRVLKQG